MTELKEMIGRRRSVRRYSSDPLPETAMEALKEQMRHLQPLTEAGLVAARIVPAEDCHFVQKWRNPHFIALYAMEGERNDEALMNVGFMFQQVDLYLQSQGYGTCWVGLGGVGDGIAPPEGMKLAVMMAFGIPEDTPLRRENADFHRRSAEEICDVPDVRLEVVRLAPSATNSQPWYFTHEGDALHVHCVVHGPIKKRMLGRMNRIDMGIALAHLYVAWPGSFRFARLDGVAVPEGYSYVGTVTL